MHTPCLLPGLLVVTLLVSLCVAAESDEDRAKREVDAFCKTVPLYCSKLSKADKQAMLKRFKAESPLASRKDLPEPHRDTQPRDTDGWPIPTTLEDQIVTACAKGAGVNPYGTITTQQAETIATCAYAIRGSMRPR